MKKQGMSLQLEGTQDPGTGVLRQVALHPTCMPTAVIRKSGKWADRGREAGMLKP